MSVSEKPLHIDIPVRLSEIKVAFSVAALAFEGDLPASIFHLQLITKDIEAWAARSQVIVVFHTSAGSRDIARRRLQRRPDDIDGQPLQEARNRPDDTRRPGGAVRCDGGSAQVGERGPAPSSSGQHRCHGAHVPARPARLH